MKRGLGSAKRAKLNSDKKSGAVASDASRSPGNPAQPADPVERDPSMEAKVAEIRERIERSVGQAVLMMVHSPRYRHQALADLEHLLPEPLLRDRVAFAYQGQGEGSANNSPPVGVALWASVSEGVEGKIREQIKAGVFPVRLAPDERTGGERLWLLDIVALNKSAASAVLLHFRTIAGDREIRLHPIVSRLVDAELLDTLRRKPA